ncbi:helix-turn-helix domain-containing protein [Pseudohongiella spirulinae]|uniref:DNA-binding protein n=1 Tax=Pseudohongiella spirulinae TaxID=1249552 RepID=A0A0S2KEQ4_9GAMM|nr:helix-turn-helix domain-containing protein [Pseudohongiella spirulinae]ALO46590.1 DNA-binding protein [Pseudohongiella spirulinae]
MSMKLMVDALKAQVGNAGRKLVLIKLADNASDDGWCWPSYQHIANDCEMGRSTVKEHIKVLAELGFITVKSRNDGKSSNGYILHIQKGRSKGEKTRSESNPVRFQPGQISDDTRSDSDPHPVRFRPPPGQILTPEPVIEPINEPVIEPEMADSPAGADESTAKSSKPDYPKEFEAIWSAYPKREGSNPKNKAFACYRARIRDGTQPIDIAAGVSRYRHFCQAKGIIGTEFVMQAVRFLGTERAFENDWIITETGNAPGQSAAGYSSKSDRDDEAMRRFLEEHQGQPGDDDAGVAHFAGVEAGDIPGGEHRVFKLASGFEGSR